MMETKENRRRLSESKPIVGKGCARELHKERLGKDIKISLPFTPGELSENALREKANHHSERDH